MADVCKLACPHCGHDNGPDADCYQEGGAEPAACAACGRTLVGPPAGEPEQAGVDAKPALPSVAPEGKGEVTTPVQEEVSGTAFALAAELPAESMPPQSPPGPDSGGLCREGWVIIQSPQATFPPRCIKCNVPARPVEIAIRWSRAWQRNPSLYLLLSVSLALPMAVFWFVSSQRTRAVVRVGLCPAHAARQRVAAQVGPHLLAVGGLVALVALAAALRGGTFVAVLATGLVVSLAGLLWHLMFGGPLRVFREDKSDLHWVGGGRAFLRTIPTTQQARGTAARAGDALADVGD